MIDIGKYLQKTFEDGEWPMFTRIASAYFCKEYYFLEPDGTVYSRYSGNMLENKEDAYREFIEDLDYFYH